MERIYNKVPNQSYNNIIFWITDFEENKNPAIVEYI